MDAGEFWTLAARPAPTIPTIAPQATLGARQGIAYAMHGWHIGAWSPPVRQGHDTRTMDSILHLAQGKIVVTNEQVNWDLEQIERSTLAPTQRVIAHMLWNARNYLRETGESKPLSDWNIKDIIKHAGGVA